MAADSLIMSTMCLKRNEAMHVEGIFIQMILDNTNSALHFYYSISPMSYQAINHEPPSN
jgi:hypothetical protein